MKPAFTRRQFLKNSVLLGAGLATSGVTSVRANPAGASEKCIIGVMGLERGLRLIDNALQLPNIEIAWVADVDAERVDRAIARIAERQNRAARGTQDFRRILDDPAVDAIFVATTNHWHAPATILACAAGKHVYVEKPGSHNPWEGEMMVAAARKHKRVVQMGNQRRSDESIREAIQRLHEGVIGPVRFARCWYSNKRGTIGRGNPTQAPDHIDYDLWQGPAPEQPFKDNLIHYNWHWHWHWGNGELGNNGIHPLDLARWGLGVEYPTRISYNGGRYHFDDDQETPDTAIATFDFGGKGISWDGSSCVRRANETTGLVRFYGDNGTLAMVGDSIQILDADGKEIETMQGTRTELRDHIANFIAAIRTGETLNSEIGDGQKSTLLCHLGNIAYRTGQTIHFDPSTRKVVGSPEAAALWKRDYRPGWEPKV